MPPYRPTVRAVPEAADLDVDLARSEHEGASVAFSIPEAGAVWFDATRADMEAQGRSVRPGLPLPDVPRSELHERTHLVHATTTPVGVYLQRLSLVQREMVMRMLELLVEAGVPIRTPLVDHVRSLGGATRAALDGPLHGWLAAERVRLELTGTGRMLTAFARRFPDAAALPHIAAARSTAVCMWVLIDRPADPTRADIAEVAEAGRAPSPEQHAAVRRAEQRIHAMVAAPTLTAIEESAAFATEYVGDERLPDIPFRSGGPHDADAPYGRLVALARELAPALAAADASTTILTLRAVAELVHFAPVLHELRDLSGASDPTAFAPLIRWSQVLTARAFRPLTSVLDHGPFCEELCAELGWPTPQQIALRVGSFRDHAVFDPVSSRFAHALDARLLRPWMYVDPWVGAVVRDRVDAAWSRTVQFDHLFFRDTEWHRPTSPVSRWQFHGYLYDTWMRQIALAAPTDVWLPFAMSAEDRAGAVEELRSHLGEDLAATVGLPTIAFRAPAFGL